MAQVTMDKWADPSIGHTGDTSNPRTITGQHICRMTKDDTKCTACHAKDEDWGTLLIGGLKAKLQYTQEIRRPR